MKMHFIFVYRRAFVRTMHFMHYFLGCNRLSRQRTVGTSLFFVLLNLMRAAIKKAAVMAIYINIWVLDFCQASFFAYMSNDKRDFFCCCFLNHSSIHSRILILTISCRMVKVLHLFDKQIRFNIISVMMQVIFFFMKGSQRHCALMVPLARNII